VQKTAFFFINALFAVTVSKAQGQMFNCPEIYLPSPSPLPCHSQLFMAFA
jgi:hypothetical protein